MNDYTIIENKVREIIKEIKEESGDIVITLPSIIKWSEYEKELQSVEDYSQVMNFKVATFPKKTKKGDKCYLCYKGQVIGWMKIVGMEEKEFTCTTTGNRFKGKFILRSGQFHKIPPIKMTGFQGYRYFFEK